MLNKTKAFSPAGISSFFQICDREPNGKPITDPELIGSRGGGFALCKGVFTEVSTAMSDKNRVEVFINEKFAPEAETTKTVINMLLENVQENYKVTVKHCVEVPIGAGFGSSAAGALGTALALSKKLSINLTYNQLGRIAHVAEVKCQTGLGTVGGLMLGGCVLVVEPGAPEYALFDRIPISQDYEIVAGVFAPRLTTNFLKSKEKEALINEMGQKTMKKILTNPSLENFLRSCREFAEKTGLVTERVRKLIEAAEEAGAIGAAQNMLGEAVHALVKPDKAENVLQVFKKHLPQERILKAKIDLQGARLLG